MTGIVVPTANEFYATRTFDEPPIPLSYLVKKSQTAMVPTLRAFLASWATPWLNCTHDESMWTPKKQLLRFHAPGGYLWGGHIDVEFLGNGWDPAHTVSDQGPMALVSSSPKTYEGAGALALLEHIEEGVHFVQNQSYSKTKERKTSLNREVHWDIGAEQTIGASGFGVSLEAKFSEGFGEKIDTGEEDSAGTSETLTKEIDFDFPPLRNTLLPLTTAQAHTRGPSDHQWAGGFLDCGLR